MRWEMFSPDEASTLELGRRLGALCRPGDLVSLVGELGAGKTRLVRGMAQGMGATSTPVSSPTFVMVQEYGCDPAAPHAVPMIHIDAYRLHSLDELESIGWEPLRAGRPGGEYRDGAVVVIEWADRLGGVLGEEPLRIEIEHVDDHTRLISLAGPAQWASRLLALSQSLKLEPQLAPGDRAHRPQAQSQAGGAPGHGG